MKRAVVVAAIAFVVAILAVSVSALCGDFTRATGNVDASAASGISEILVVIGFGGLNLLVISGAAILVLGTVVLVRSVRRV